MCLQQCSPADASLQCMAVPQHSCTQMGRRRWPPPGGVQSAAHRRCGNGVLNHNHIFLSAKAQDLSQMAKLQMASSSSLSGSWTPLFFSPQEPGDHRRPCAKKRKSVALWLFLSIFCPSKLQSKFCIEKTSKKVRKSRILASQTPPKTRLKSF